MEEFPLQQVLELACAAQRINGAYIKYDGETMYTHQSNKMLMLYTIVPIIWTSDPKDAPMPLRILPEDTALAEDIKKHFRKFMFGAIEGENEFQTNINSFLNAETISTKNFGYIACLPSVYVRDVTQTKIKKIARTVEEGYLGAIGDAIKDLDCEILESAKSKNFEGYNISAIINNRMASWLNKVNLNLGACVIIRAKVKEHSKHWKHGNNVTRLNYVKAAQ
jgi:hypothetical protein